MTHHDEQPLDEQPDTASTDTSEVLSEEQTASQSVSDEAGEASDVAAEADDQPGDAVAAEPDPSVNVPPARRTPVNPARRPNEKDPREILKHIDKDLQKIDEIADETEMRTESAIAKEEILQDRGVIEMPDEEESTAGEPDTDDPRDTGQVLDARRARQRELLQKRQEYDAQRRAERAAYEARIRAEQEEARERLRRELEEKEARRKAAFEADLERIRAEKEARRRERERMDAQILGKTPPADNPSAPDPAPDRDVDERVSRLRKPEDDEDR